MMLVSESYETISSISGEIKIDGGFNTKTIAEYMSSYMLVLALHIALLLVKVVSICGIKSPPCDLLTL